MRRGRRGRKNTGAFVTRLIGYLSFTKAAVIDVFVCTASYIRDDKTDKYSFDLVRKTLKQGNYWAERAYCPRQKETETWEEPDGNTFGR